MAATKLLLVSTVGSVMHECATQDSDIDIRMVACTPVSEMISPFTMGQIKPKHASEGDTVTYELRHFLSLLASGSPSAMEVVFGVQATPLDDFGALLLTNARKFVAANRAQRNCIGMVHGRVANARRGQKPFKSLRSALLGASMTRAFLRGEPYNPLTAAGRTAILKGDTEEGIRGMRSALEYLVSEIASTEFKDEYDPEFVTQFNIAAYMEGFNAETIPTCQSLMEQSTNKGI